MEKTAEYVRGMGKHLLWIPYVTSEEQYLAIGDIANQGINNKTIFDVILLQPGAFYRELGKPHPELENTDQFDMFTVPKMNWIYNSVDKQMMLDKSGNIIGGGKDENIKTRIGVQFENDMSIVTGRDNQHNAGKVDWARTMPSEKKAMLYKHYYLMYSKFIGKAPTGYYVGGPNEQAFSTPMSNNNMHSNKNYMPHPWYGSYGLAYSQMPVPYNGNYIFDWLRVFVFGGGQFNEDFKEDIKLKKFLGM